MSSNAEGWMEESGAEAKAASLDRAKRGLDSRCKNRKADRGGKSEHEQASNHGSNSG